MAFKYVNISSTAGVGQQSTPATVMLGLPEKVTLDAMGAMDTKGWTSSWGVSDVWLAQSAITK